MFPKSTYVNRRKELKNLVGNGIILLPGNEEVGMNYAGNVYPFRQDSTFLYYFGLDKPGLTAIIDIDNNQEIIFGNDPTVEEIVWTGPQVSLVDMAVECGVTDVRTEEQLESAIKQAKSSNRVIHYLPPYRYRSIFRLSEYFDKKPHWTVNHASIELIKAVAAQRSIKDDEEIREIEKAVEITAWMHKRAMEFAKPGMLEMEVAAEINKVALESGPGLSFPSIVTVRGEVLHNQSYKNILREGQLLLVDAGAESSLHYAGDMSRTFPVNHHFSEVQKQVYQIALDSLKSGVNMLKPGTRYLDVHLTAARTIVEGFKLMGLMKGDAEEAVTAGAHTLFFQCGTGHMMGLDVHDMENLGEQYVGYTDNLKKSTEFGLKSLRLGKELEPGYVVTVEPGIYFIPNLIDTWKHDKKLEAFINYDEVEKFRNFGGLRSEDDYVITKDGAQRLGPKVAEEISEIEAIRGRALN